MSADAPAAMAGLAPSLAATRLRDEGPNELGLSQRRTLRDIAWEVLHEPMFGLLLGAGVIYLAMGDAREALILLGFVFIIMGITALQERRTDRALDALRDLSSPRALVLRGGQAVRVPGREVVREDVLLLAEGDRVPADGVLLQAHELATDESMLTGITLAMGILPQEFPVILIVFFAFGARRIAAHGVLTRRLAAIETLGQTTVLCVDKTGTLTRNRMAVATLTVGDERLISTTACSSPNCRKPSIGCSNMRVLASETDPHDPMEKAFLSLAGVHLANTEHLHPDWQLAREYELSPDMLAMSHLWRLPSGQRATTSWRRRGHPRPIADCVICRPKRANGSWRSGELADRGLRVLAVAHAVHPGADWPACSMISRSASSAWSAWPIRCGRAFRGRWPNVAAPACAW
jgi:magnesium-transporting ATPase (P-type)